jgi:hypothetical protein
MNYLSYRDHTIVSSAAMDELTGRYYAVASISWTKSDGTPGVHIINNSSDTCENSDEACNRAVELAKAWIDHRLTAEAVSHRH